MKKEEKIDLVEFFIEDEFENVIGDLSLVSFVSDPAIEQTYKMFSANKYVFAQTEKEEMLVIGPAMRANKPILRQRPDGTYFNCVFSEDQVKRCSEIFLKNLSHKQTNLEHGALLGPNEIDGVYVTQTWIVDDPNNDKAAARGFKEVEKGDWYLAYRVENDSFWNFIKEFGGGFSIEGMFAERMAEKFSNLMDEEYITKKVKELTYSDNISEEQFKEEIKKLLKI